MHRNRGEIIEQGRKEKVVFIRVLWIIGIGLMVRSTAFAAESSMMWPYHRVAMQLEAVRVALGEPEATPWARALNDRIRFECEVKFGDLDRLHAVESLSALRLWSRLQGPPPLPKPGTVPTIQMSVETVTPHGMWPKRECTDYIPPLRTGMSA